jgi:hypothetical protein
VRLDNGLLVRYAKDTGTLQWCYRLAQPTTGKVVNPGTPAVTVDRIYIPASDGSLYALDEAALDGDTPVFNNIQPQAWQEGTVDRKNLRTLGASIEDVGSGIRLDSVTMKLDGSDLTPYLHFNAKTLAYTVEINPSASLALGTHLMEMTTVDNRGTTASLTRGFIIGDSLAERALVVINGDLMPRDISVPAGSVIIWVNKSGSPRGIKSDDGLFTSESHYRAGIPVNSAWAWSVPISSKPGTVLAYTVRTTRLTGSAIIGTVTVIK